MSYETSRRGITGGTVERELFGRTEKPERELPHEVLKKALQRVRELQPGDPTDPSSEFAADALANLEEILNAQDGEVSFFTAIGSPLDRDFGIDGWFEYQQRMVTIDITTNPGKGSYKADITFPVPRDGLDSSVDEAQFKKYASALAQIVAERFISTASRTVYDN